MSNTSLPINELMLSKRAAETKPARGPEHGDGPTPAAAERFERLLRTADQHRGVERRPADRSAGQDHRRPDDRADRPAAEKPSHQPRPTRSSARDDEERSVPKADDRVASGQEDDRMEDEPVDEKRSVDEDATGDESESSKDNELTDSGEAEVTTARRESGTTVEGSTVSRSDVAPLQLQSEQAGEPETSTAESGELAGSADEATIDSETVVAEDDAAKVVGHDDAADDTVTEAGSSTGPAQAVAAASRPTVQTAIADQPVKDETAAEETTVLAAAATGGDGVGSDSVEAGQTTVPVTDSAQPQAEGTADAAAVEGEQAPDAGTAQDEPSGEESDSDGQAPEADADNEADAEPDIEVAPPAVAGQARTGSAAAGRDTVATVAGLGDRAGAAQVAGTAGTAPAEQADGADPLWRQVRRALGSLRNLPTGDQQLTIRLRPDDLGSVVVRISTGETGTTVNLVAESAAAATQLSQQRQQLVNQLQDGGLRGVAVDVGTSADADRSQSEQNDTDVDQTDSAGGSSQSVGVTADGEIVRGYRDRPERRSSEGLVDLDL